MTVPLFLRSYLMILLKAMTSLLLNQEKKLLKYWKTQSVVVSVSATNLI
jgi:hypothetical protein